MANIQKNLIQEGLENRAFNTQNKPPKPPAPQAMFINPKGEKINGNQKK